MKYAYHENGVVREVVQVEPSTIFLSGYAAQFLPCPDDVEPGWVWDGEHFTPAPPAPPVVPAFVTMRQARLALLGAGLLDDVDAAINAMPSPQKEAVRIAWEYSQEVQRNNGVVAALGPLLGLTDAQIDDLFLAAAQL